MRQLVLQYDETIFPGLLRLEVQAAMQVSVSFLFSSAMPSDPNRHRRLLPLKYLPHRLRQH